MEFVNLYLESEYSMLNSSVKLKELINFYVEDKVTSCAITDLDNMHGVIKFYCLCKENGIKPIVGLHLTLDSHYNYYNSLLLYAKNNKGYKDLLKISSIRKFNSKLYLEDIIKYLNDIIVILPNEEHELMKAYEEKNTSAFESIVYGLRNIPTLYLGLDLQTEKMVKSINNIIKDFQDLNISLVAINKTSYIYKEDFEVYKILKGVFHNVKGYKHNEKEENSFLLTKEKVNDLFRQYPFLLENTSIISDCCDVQIEFGKYRMPIYDEKKNTSEYLRDLAIIGLRKRLIDNKINKTFYKEYLDRLDYELSIINKMGFCDYFLIVYDFIKYSKKEKILVGPGRGSGPSSLVAYSLGITEVDPLKFGLLFERFLNPERISMPDIDTDFPDNERGKVLEYMGRRYGKMRVAHICTFGTYGPKLAVRDVSRVIELSNIYLDEILKLLGDSNSILDVLNSNETYKRMYEEDDVVRFVTDTVARMENLPRNSSVHAAGIIMADCDLIEYTPLANSIDGLYESQYEASDLEKLGLVKIDFLGLKNLSIISNVLKLISGHNDAINGFNIYNLPLDDKKTYKTIASGNTNGIFQLESSGMRNTLMKLETSEFNDIVSANALYRPGPMDMISSYINRKLGNEKIVYMHPDLEGILKSTYGIIVYQEQILLIASKFAGYSLGEADVLRRAVSKKRLDVLESERSKFVSGAKRKGYSDSVCQEVFDYILKFASYGFNKSHSVSYSMVSYQMAYLKTHYFKEFMAVLMTDKVGSVSSIKSYILECANHRISVLPPSINKSGLDFVIENDNIYYSLLGINGLGDVIVRNIINERNKEKFKNYDEFICRTKDFLNKKHIEGLIYSGALDDFKITRKAMIEEYEQSLQLSTFGEVFREELSTHVFSDDEYSFDVIASYESFALGFNLKFDVFKRYSEYKKKYKTIDLKDVKNKSVALVLFQIQKVRVITTKNNEEMAFVSAYDDSAEMDMVLFPKTYLLYRQIIKNGRVYIAEIKVDTRNNTLQGNVNKLRLLD